MSATLTADVAIIGGGPAGLAAATSLAGCASATVIVLEREQEAGGIPRHSDHLGYGIRDRRRFISGPTYASRLVREAREAGVDIRTGTMVTNWSDDGVPEVTSPEGRARVEARAVILATGARERPRPARMIPGGRPAGVYTTGELQTAVHMNHQTVGSRAVVVGGELVSWSAVMTLKQSNCAVQLLVTTHHRPESYAAFNLAGRMLLRTKVATRTRVVQVLGRSRVTGVEIEDRNTGRRRIIKCDTVVFTGDWIPDHELVRSGGITLDSGTRGPLVDSIGRTNQPGVFAVGNLVHPVDTADIAAIGGSHGGRCVAHHLNGGRFPTVPSIAIVAGPPFKWVTPGIYRPGLPSPSRNRIESWVEEVVRFPRVVVRQDGHVLARRALPWAASPGRVFRIPWNLLHGVKPAGGPIELSL